MNYTSVPFGMIIAPKSNSKYKIIDASLGDNHFNLENVDTKQIHTGYKLSNLNAYLRGGGWIIISYPQYEIY